MLDHLREIRYQEGKREREARCKQRQSGCLPKRQDSAYLEGYLKNRPEGLDSIVQYFPTVEAFLNWRSKTSERLN